MKSNILHYFFLPKSVPYILDKKSDMIRLEMMSPKYYSLSSILYISVLIMSPISLLFSLLSLLKDPIHSHVNIAIATASILFFLYAFYLFIWERKGREIFILSANELERSVVIKPFKAEKKIYTFSQLIICYESDDDLENMYEEDDYEQKQEPDLTGVTGNYPIRFIIDNGIDFVDSSRRIPIEVIRRIRDEYLLIKTRQENE